MNSINEFKGKYRFLSNFYPCIINYEGIIYPSVEHAFQALKTEDINKRKLISEFKYANEAKKFGRHIELRSDWEDIKLDIMEELIRLKFYFNENLKQMLIATNDAILIEGNWWNDTFWGMCNNKGENHLGEILMKIRKDLIEKDILELVNE